ncbi:MAG: membrane protein insertase YidC [Oscillospiraceae bacterium]|nr:membrane protein insertase YidC [Oscillospiraceae bacterium]
MEVLYRALEWVLMLCYGLCKNYGLAIILFTLLSKIILLPISVWLQKNSIKMVKMQPEINRLKAAHFGDPDAIAEGQSQIFKREKYHPMASIIPLVIQIILLMGLIEAIRAGMSDGRIDMRFLGVDLSLVPSVKKGWLVLSPILAGLSAWAMCAAQNAANVLQSEQSNWNKYGMLVLSVALSLYLGWFVPVGVAVYWIASNLLAIVQLYALNAVINPKDYVDYEALEQSKQELAALQSLGGKKKKLFGDAEAKREKADYKRFFSVVNKHLVYYSESSGFYKYYQRTIEYLLKNTNLTIHYITSDPNDAVFDLAKTQSRIKPYFIGEKKLITLMMKMDADVVVMTMPDIENYHIKRSYVRKDIEYIYVQHGMGSINLTMRKGAEDHYDTVFCVGEHQKQELREMEALNRTPEKNLVETGYSLLDDMIAQYEGRPHVEREVKQILIAPSWQKDNIVDSCLEKILDGLQGKGYDVTVRPHPQHVRHQGAYMEQLKARYESCDDVTIQTDFSSNTTVFDADLLITDWSDIAWEFAFTTKKPVLFINTPMKVMNPDWEKIKTVPMNIELRNVVGCALELDDLDKIGETAETLLNRQAEFREAITQTMKEHVYHVGGCAEVEGKYIISAIQRKIRDRKETK